MINLFFNVTTNTLPGSDKASVSFKAIITLELPIPKAEITLDKYLFNKLSSSNRNPISVASCCEPEILIWLIEYNASR